MLTYARLAQLRYSTIYIEELWTKNPNVNAVRKSKMLLILLY